ncbi:MAG: ATP-dependent RNA helicase [Spirochaetaceae bacterium]|nr:ATP-dependent RNA helicase [Spirochaetaceae bacterium]
MDYKKLPVYAEKDKILECLKTNQVIVVESPTGSGKTTQLPIILHEAGYSAHGIIGVTQPRRIAALSVSEFIAKQLKVNLSELVGCKMRFTDLTSADTAIKIMTDGILLQELKLDPWLTSYSVIMVDEAHERSLNIDFVLGLLTRILQNRPDFKVIISSATINTEMFSLYFDDCPIVKIPAETYPVTLIFDPPHIEPATTHLAAETALLEKISAIMSRIVHENRSGAVLIFLPGEKAIKDCAERLATDPGFGRKLHIVPLYGRLSKEEQERVFQRAPFGKRKVVISTNIAETSITINDVVTVIDSGLAKLNHYNPFTFTSSLEETTISKASCNQRRGRAGRTQAGVCYRLYSRADFEERPMYTTEEIYRTDLSEVVLRMSELGIYDFEHFYFISPPGRKDIIGAIDTLNMLSALNEDRSLSEIGKLMCAFPLSPRQSRIIVEAILHFPNSLEEVLIAASFLSSRSPFIFPEGFELEATQAHARFNDKHGDFVSFLHILKQYLASEKKGEFCKKNFLDERIMAEIANIKDQLEMIVGDLGIPILSGGSLHDYLQCIATGMVQFVCVSEGRGSYTSSTVGKIFIHPGSCLYKTNPEFIVAGEIVRTTRMYAMSVSLLPRSLVAQVAPALLKQNKGDEKGLKKQGTTTNEPPVTKTKPKTAKQASETSVQQHKSEWHKSADKGADKNACIYLFGKEYRLEKKGGKKFLLVTIKEVKDIIACMQASKKTDYTLEQAKGLRVKLCTHSGNSVLVGERFETVLKIVQTFNLTELAESEIALKKNFLLTSLEDMHELVRRLPHLFRTSIKGKKGELGFVTLCCDGKEAFWFKISRKFSSALHEAFYSMQVLANKASVDFSETEQTAIKGLYAKMSQMIS